MNRYTFILIVALAALLGSVTTLFSTLQQRDEQLRGYVDASQDANLPFYLPRLGINADLTQYSAAELDYQLDLMDQAHLHWVRQMVRWDQLEPQPGQYHWEQWDSIIRALGAHPNLRLIAVLVNTPDWARVNRPSQLVTAPPDNADDFAAFAREFTLRYGTSVDYYQIWDEPNLTAAWGGLEPRVADYVTLLTAAYTAIHAADPVTVVISAALAPTTETGPKNISDILYLQDMYAVGARAYFDAVGAKPYGFSSSPEDRMVSPDVLNFSRVIALREVMVSNGDGAKSLWASSWGWNSLPEDWSGQPSIWGSVSADTRIAYTLAALSRAEREWPWLAGMTLQHWQPVAAPDDPQWGFAVIDAQGNPSLLWRALVSRPQPATAQNALFPAVNPFTHYSGVWKFGSLGADIGWVQDSQFDFSFSGNAVSLLLRQDDYTAYLYPTIDGAQANAVPHDPSGNAYIILTSGSRLPETNLVQVGINLNPGTHTLHVVADRGWDHWAIAGFGVSSGSLADPFNRQIGVALLAAMVALATVVVTIWQAQWTIPQSPQWLANFQRRLTVTGHVVLGLVSSVALLIGLLMTWGESIPSVFRRDPIPLGLAIATAGLIKLEPGFVLTVIAALVLFFIFYSHLEIGLTLILFWSPFFLFPVELYHRFFPLSEVLLLLTVVAWLVTLLVHFGQGKSWRVLSLSALRRKLTLMDYGVILWVILGVVSLLWSVYRAEAVTELRVMLIEPALFYAVFRTTRLSRVSVLRMVDALVIAGLVVALIGLWQFAHGEAVITAEGGAQRLASVYGSPNNVGLFLGRCLSFVFAFLLVRVDRRRRLLALIALLPMGIALVLSQSVGALFVGVPAAFIAVALLAWGKRARLLLAVFLVLAVVAFVIALQFPRFARVLDFTSGTNLYRIRVWASAVNIIHDHPITGLGLDQFLYAFRGHYIMPDAWQEPNLSHPHNIILDFWVRLGLLGVALLVIFQVAFWKNARNLYRVCKNRDPIDFAVTVGMIGSMVNLLSHGLIDNSVYVQDLVYVFVFLLALAGYAPNTRAIDEPSI